MIHEPGSNAKSLADIAVPIDRQHYRRVAGLWPSGVAVITATDTEGRPFGLTMSSVTSLSLEPPLFLICVDQRSETLPAILSTMRYCINFLAREQHEVSSLFATKSPDKFGSVAHRVLPSGQVEICGALAVIECEVEQFLPGGDHTILIGRAHAMDGREGEPLLHFRGAYREIGDQLPQPSAAGDSQARRKP